MDTGTILVGIAAITAAALVVEKLVERLKEQFGLTGHWTSLVALVLSALIVLGVPSLRVLVATFGEGVHPIADVAFTVLSITAGSGFLATWEQSRSGR